MNGIWKIEKEIYQFINHQLSNPLFDTLLPFLEHEINFLLPMAVVFSIVFFMGSRKVRIFVLWLLIVAGSTKVFNTEILKNCFQRVRPHHTYQKSEFNLRLEIKEAPKRDDYSFPSGHTAFAFSLALFATLYFARLWVGLLAYFLAFLMGFSRIYIGVHYPLDVLGGILSGSLMAALCYWLMIKLKGSEWYENLMNRLTRTKREEGAEEA